MAELILNNGTRIEVDDSSSHDRIEITGTFEKTTEAVKAITTESINHAILYDEPIINRIVDGFDGSREGNTYKVGIILRTFSEWEEVCKRLDEQDAALIELASLVIGG